jgi:O-antigen chain-terminating methyltransferase
VESAELVAILREVRERVRTQRPESSGSPAGIPVTDLMGLVHARDSALGKVAAIGTVNPRAGGLANSLVQAWKRLVARVLDWHVREQVEFNRQVLACVDAAIEAFNEDNRALVELGNRIRAAVEGSQENLRAAQESLGQDIQAAQEGLRHEFQESLGQDVLAAQEGLRQEFKVIQESLGQDIRAAQESLGRDLQAAQDRLGQDIQAAQEEIRMVHPEMADIRKHWAEWRAGWEFKLAQNEIQFLRSVADLQGAFQHRATLMDMSFRETVRGQHADFTSALERSAVEIQKRLWLEFERTIHAELRIIRQRSQIVAAGVVGAGHSATHGQVAQPVPEPAPPAIDTARFALCFRGSEEYVKAGQRHYLPNFEGCQNVLDIGCGRGEFLEIMREANIPAVGIDLSQESVAMCRLKGLQAETADLFTYLAGLPEDSLDGIFCAQVVEHLPPPRLPEMIQLCAGRLRRNGVMVIETPNPECLAIFATHFYLDPTHARPVPHPLLAFYLEEFGVGIVEVRKLAPAVESMPSLDSLPEAFREAFFGGLDYAIIGKKL